MGAAKVPRPSERSPGSVCGRRPAEVCPSRPSLLFTRSDLGVAVGLSAALALASLALPSAPGYDPWSWLIWGRELASLDLSTSEGPAWKPLPAMVTAAIALLGEEIAPPVWLVIARAGAILAVLVAFVLARRLAGGSIAAGVAAVAGVLLIPGWIEHAATGNAEGPLTALLLLGLAGLLEGRLRAALALLAVAALIRVEVWPFLALLVAAVWRRDGKARPWLVAGSVGVMALWFVPEWLASGDPLRSADRARMPNPGAPALASRPALATLAEAARGPHPVALVGLVLLALPGSGRRGAREALLAGVAGVAWALLVAAMSELGFSGEARYLVPGSALVVVAGTAGLFLVASAAREGNAGEPSLALAGVVATAVALTALDRTDIIGEQSARAAHGALLAADLDRAIDRAGGAGRLLRCGRPYTGRYRGPLLAWALGVPKAAVDFSPSRPGVAFRSRLTPASRVEPPMPPPQWRIRTARWEIAGSCRRTAAQRGSGLGYPNP